MSLEEQKTQRCPAPCRVCGRECLVEHLGGGKISEPICPRCFQHREIEEKAHMMELKTKIEMLKTNPTMEISEETAKSLIDKQLKQQATPAPVPSVVKKRN